MSDTQKAGAVNQLTEVIQREQSKWTFPLDMSAAEKFAANVVEAVLAARQPAAKDVEKAAEAAYRAMGYVSWDTQQIDSHLDAPRKLITPGKRGMIGGSK